MKFIDEYRDPEAARRLSGAIQETVTRPWTIMEVCGGQTHTLLKFGIDQLLPPGLRLVHGPGCPVCVTPLQQIDQAIALALRPGVIVCTFGDMLRVPGSTTDLQRVRAAGGQVRMVYSPLDAVRLAQANPAAQVVFFAVGFETTAPATALAVLQAKARRLANFAMLVAHVRVPPAMALILSAPTNRVQGFLAPGHVCTVMGYREYRDLAARFRVPIVVTGFEPLDLLEGVLLTVRQLEQGRHDVQNQYARCVRAEGNQEAQRIVEQVYEPVDRTWRGFGVIPGGGLQLRRDFAEFDAAVRFPPTGDAALEPAACRAAEVMQGLLRPDECQAFGKECKPEHPLGAPMVSSEGACAAYWHYRRYSPPRDPEP